VKYALLIYAGTTEESIGQLSALEQTAILNEYRALAQEHDMDLSSCSQSILQPPFASKTDERSFPMLNLGVRTSAAFTSSKQRT